MSLFSKLLSFNVETIIDPIIPPHIPGMQCNYIRKLIINYIIDPLFDIINYLLFTINIIIAYTQDSTSIVYF